jgi:hypothetical protein
MSTWLCQLPSSNQNRLCNHHIEFSISTHLKHIQDVSGEAVNILGVYMYMCPIPNGFRESNLGPLDL